MTFTMHKKGLLTKLKKKRCYEMYLDSHFSGKQERFENLNTFGDSQLDAHKYSYYQGKSLPLAYSKDKDDDLFYSWECISLIKKGGTTLDLVVKDA